MHSSRMRTAHSSSRPLGGVSASVHAGINPPGPEPGDPPGVGLETPWPDPQPTPWPGPGPRHPPTPVDRILDTRF